MRIGLLIYGSLDTVSGGYLYDRQLVRYLEAQGDHVQVVSIPWRNYPKHLFDNLSTDLFNRLLNLPVDILLQDELNHPSLFYLNQRLKKAASYRMISIVHHLRSSEFHTAWKRAIYQLVERHYLDSVDGFIYNSQNTRHQVESLSGVSKDNVVAYPAGNRFHQELTQEMIEIRASQEGPLKILFLGNVIPRKGLHILLKALGEIEEKDWYLSVVGSLDFDPEYVNRIMQVVHGSGFAKKVMFFGPLQEDQLKEVMLNCHILAMPSYHEGFGIAYLEGMGFGLPAIGTTSGGASEIITHEVNGFLLPREDAPVLGENIARLIDDRKLLTRMSLAALERFNQHPPWDDSMSRVRSFLDKIIQQDE